jgi:lantibiotic leader peptide-processing serine protease
MTRNSKLQLALSVIAAAAVSLPASAAFAAHYVIAFNQPSGLPNNVDKMVAAAGGTIVERIPEIGGIGVESSNPNFASAMSSNASVKAVGLATETSLAPTWSQADVGIDSSNNNSNASPTGSDCTGCMPDSLGNEQWDKKKLHATLTGSYAVQQGRKDVKVFVIDTGADQTHIDVAANLSPQTFPPLSPPACGSASFVPTEPTIQDFHGHGTWTISAVGGPINGVGISGVAPNVTLVEGKVLSGAGSGLFLWTDQAMVYAGLCHFDVVSASLGGFIPKCGAVNQKPDACDHPDYILLNRATQFARSNGVLPVAALGNNGFDVSDGHFFGDFVEAPGEIAGWVGVAATGYPDDKAFYSNYGTGKTDVSAPGGNTRNYSGVPGSATCPHGSLCRLIGAWSSTGTSAPSDPIEQCTGPGGTPPCFLYGYVQGTSMATPNTAGVAALIISQYGDFSSNNPNKIHMSPTAVESILQQTANNQPCPTPNTVVQGPGVLPTATCQGNTGYNNFFGKGIVDALNAVTTKTP